MKRRLGSTFSWPKKSIPAPGTHTHARNWRLNLFSKGALKLTTNSLEILKSEQQRTVERTSLSTEFITTGSATCLPKYINQVYIKKEQSKI